MRLIDAEAFEELFYQQMALGVEGGNAAEDALHDTPTVDAVPVVRCKDCKHWIPCQGEELKGHMYCEWAQWLVGENAYCVYGERKGHADNYPSGE